MKTFLPGIRRAFLISGWMIFFSLFFFATSNSQKISEISLSAYPGYTLVNFEEALDYSDEDMEDWSEIHLSAALRAFLSSAGKLQFGAEFAWQRLYYAYYVVPYGPSPVYREFNVSTISFMALGRLSFNKFFTTGGAGVHIFDDGVAPAICLEGGYKISLSEKLKIPLSVRVNPVFGSGTPVPFSLGMGLSYILD